MNNMFDYKKWLDFCKNPAEMQKWQELMTKYTANDWVEYSEKWNKMFNKVEKSLDLDPKSADAQKLFEEWTELFNSIYGDYPTLKKHGWDALKSGLMFQMKYFNQAVLDYIDKLAKYHGDH
jgi:hypothetical protein